MRRARLALALAGGGVVALLALVALLARPFPAPAWSEQPPHDSSIYDAAPAGDFREDAPPVVSPFHLQTQPMRALLLVNFEGDPDSTYRGLEPQAFDDDVHGRGLIVIGWRTDGRVDVFHDPALALDPATYAITGRGLHAMAARDFASARLGIGASGVHAVIAFSDLQGRSIRLVVSESDARPRRPFGLLAPMGSAVAEPPALPLVYVDDFYFVRKAGSRVVIEIDGRSHRPDSIPLALDGARVHFLRYSARPFIVTWNPSAGAVAVPLVVTDDRQEGVVVAEALGDRYELSRHGPFHEIRGMSRRQGEHGINVEFSPPVPHLLALRDGVDVAGLFRIRAGDRLGVVSGGWRVSRRGRDVHLDLSPTGWTPGPVPPMVRLLFRVAPVFQDWPATYRWTGRMELPEATDEPQAALPLASAWQRTP